MKRLLSLCLIFILSMILLTSCQNNTAEKDTELPETGYPAGETNGDEAYPIEEPSQEGNTSTDLTMAYPIPEDSLALLQGTWTLSTRSESGVTQEEVEKQLTLRDDGSYEITSSDGTTSGTWTAYTNATEAILMLDFGSGYAVAYEIVELSENGLLVHYQLDGIDIDELYQPMD